MNQRSLKKPLKNLIKSLIKSLTMTAFFAFCIVVLHCSDACANTRKMSGGSGGNPQRCELVFDEIGSAPSDFTTVSSEFKLKDSQKHWTYELQNLPEVQNQCQLGVCHMMAWTNFLEINRSLAFKQQNHSVEWNEVATKNIKLDSDYLAYHSWIKSAETFLLSDNPSTTKIELAASSIASWKLIQEVGLIPKGILFLHKEYKQQY